MSNEKPTKKTASAVAAVMLAVVMIGTICAAFFAINPAASSGSSSTVDAAAEKSAAKVAKFEEDSVRTNAVFSDAVFKRVCGAALAYKGDDAALEQIASTFSFETVAVTDDKGVVTASFPDGQKGKALKDSEDTVSLNPVAKGILVKTIGTITPMEDGNYLVTAAAHRTDSDKGGAIVVTLISDTYGAVLGENLAESCGDNVIVEQDGKVISSDFTGAEGKTINDLGVTEDGKVTEIKVGDKTYQAKAITSGSYRVLTAVEPQGSAGSGWSAFLVISITCAALAIIGCVVVFVAGKPKA